MKLTPENIARLEEYISDSHFMKLRELGKKYGFGKKPVSDEVIASHFAAALRKLGIPIGRFSDAGIDSSELAEFRRWKASQNGAAAP